MSSVIIIAFVLVGIFFKFFNIYSDYKNADKGLNEQCKEKGIIDESSIKEYKRKHWRKGLKLTARIFAYLSIPVGLFFIYIWFLVS
ncbi:hypothetical protein GAB14E_4486 [Colwellia psychrerythraea]|uniref:Uncharacterized protein n=1 Tax=Colwellia psychrerythraea TaxID=28229 RepID=A0A099KDZ0_COLPS|nr:hypothetical protein GAB14E_4486 [Colwellia psychrerythraea]